MNAIIGSILTLGVLSALLLGLILFHNGVIHVPHRAQAAPPTPQAELAASRIDWVRAERQLMEAWELQCQCPDPERSRSLAPPNNWMPLPGAIQQMPTYPDSNPMRFYTELMIALNDRAASVAMNREGDWYVPPAGPGPYPRHPSPADPHARPPGMPPLLGRYQS